MDVGDFEHHLRNGESTTVEFKRCGNKPGQDTFETICSFGNRLGGSIFLGVEDDGTVVGIGSPNADEVKRNVINVANNPRLFDSWEKNYPHLGTRRFRDPSVQRHGV